MTLYGFGTTTTGLCIDIGHSYTGIRRFLFHACMAPRTYPKVLAVTPVIDGLVQDMAKTTIALAGQSIHRYFAQLLAANALPHDEAFVTYLIETSGAVEISQDPRRAHAALPKTIEVQYNDTPLTIGEFRTTIADVLFDPELIDSSSISLIDAIATSVQHCPPETRPILMNNLALTGGCAHLKGLPCFLSSLS